MSFDREIVRNVATLARLELTEQEEGDLATQLGRILEHFEELAALAVDDVEPTASVIEAHDAWREDAATNPAGNEELLANAPARDGNFFRVPRIIE